MVGTLDVPAPSVETGARLNHVTRAHLAALALGSRLHAAIKVALYLDELAEGDGTFATRLRTIATATRLHDRIVTYGLSELERAGVITRDPQKQLGVVGRFTSSR